MSESECENATKLHVKRNRTREALQKNVSNRFQRLRYWTSYEELRLVELWRRYFSDIKAYDKNEPIHRVIADGMKERHLNLNAQECRRKINVLRNKYFAERKRLVSQSTSTCPKSDWYLYRYIDCIYNPIQANTELRHEVDTLSLIHSTMAAKRPGVQCFQPSQAYKRIKINRDANTFPFLNTASNNTTIGNIEPIKKRKPIATEQRLPLQQHTPKTQKPAAPQLPQSVIIAESPIIPSTQSSTAIAAAEAINFSLPTNTAPARRNRRLLPKRGNITLEHIEHLRAENQQLALQRDQQLKLLEMEEQEVVQLECYFNQWQKQQEKLIEIFIQRAVGD